ncbi:MAG: PilZ domain-containing protein [Planctomycetota bacterium]
MADPHAKGGTRGQERRRSPRVSASFPLTVTARDAGARAELRNISQNGLCCIFPEQVPEMALVRLNLEIDDEDLEIDGAVVRSVPAPGGTGWEIAVFFTGIASSTREKLRSCVAKRCSATGSPGGETPGERSSQSVRQ